MKDMQNTKNMYSIRIQDERVNKLLEDVISYKKPMPVEINGIKVLISSKDREQLEEVDTLKQSKAFMSIEEIYGSIHSDKASRLNFKEAERIAKEVWW